MQPAIENSPPTNRNIRIILWLFVLVSLIVLSLAWRFTPLVQMIDTESILTSSRLFESRIWDCIAVIMVYTLLGLISFPIVVLIPATAAVFGITNGFTYSLIALFVNASVLYFLGFYFSRQTSDLIRNKQLNRVSEKLSKHSFMTIVILRLLPAAPYSIVNLLAGALRVPFIEYSAGTVIGIAPSVIIMTTIGYQVKKVLVNAVSENVLILSFGTAVLIIMAFLFLNQFKNGFTKK